MKNGVIAERGTHEELIGKNEIYASMWNKQAKAAKAAEDARNATLKAQKLARRASQPTRREEDSSSSSDESALIPWPRLNAK